MSSLSARFNAWMAAHDPTDNPATAAATVLALREGPAGPEVLMLQRNSRGTFASNWVFPGGKVDPEDFDDTGDLLNASEQAARREALEEADLVLGNSAVLVPFSHWMPPAVVPRRFSTWFFLTAAPGGTDGDVTIDGGEIVDHLWVRPQDALDRHSAGDVELVPPTWITLFHLAQFVDITTAISTVENREPPFYVTRMIKAEVPTVMWHGDAGYDSGDLEATGGRHRLTMDAAGWQFDESGRMV